MTHEERYAALKDKKPPLPKPAGVYKGLVVVNNLCYVSGHGPIDEHGEYLVGRVGEDVDLEGGKLAARLCGLAILVTLKQGLGDLNRIKRAIKTLGMVNCTSDFQQHPAVINGFSELMAEVFGPDDGIGARSAVGMPSLPSNIPVEVEVIFELHG